MNFLSVERGEQAFEGLHGRLYLNNENARFMGIVGANFDSVVKGINHMVTLSQKASHQNKRVINLEFEVAELQNLLQIASDQRDIVAAAHTDLFVACKAVGVAACLETTEQGVVYVVPVEVFNQMLFILDGKPA